MFETFISSKLRRTYSVAKMMRALDCVSPTSFKITPGDSTEVFAIDASMAGSRRDLESQSNSNSTDKKRSIWWNILFDVPLLAIVLAILALYELDVIPTHKSGFYCNDPKLSLKFTGDTVTATMLVTSVLLAPLIIFFIAELFLIDSEYLRSRPLEALRRVGLLYRNYAYGLVLNLLAVEVMKGVAGMPRPSFFQLCQPDTAVNCTTGEYIDTFECTSSYGWNKHDSYRSFPSGHTSTSVYCGLFISWYFQRRAFSWSSRSVFIVPFVQLGCISYAVVCSLSRISDHRHHWWDVLAGVGIGVVTLLFAVFAISDNFSTLRRPILSKSLQQSSADLLYDTSRRRPVS